MPGDVGGIAGMLGAVVMEVNTHGCHATCPYGRSESRHSSARSRSADSSSIVGHSESAVINRHVGVSKEGWRIQ